LNGHHKLETQVLLHTSKEAGLDIIAEKIKGMLMSHAGQNHNIRKVIK
jgi:hypothetical protein